MPTIAASSINLPATSTQQLSHHAQSLREASDGATVSSSFLFTSGSYSLVAVADPLRRDSLKVCIGKTEFGPTSPGDISKLETNSFMFCRAIEERYPGVQVQNATRGETAEILNRVPHSVGTGSLGLEQPWARSGAYRLAAALDERDVEHPRIVVVIVHSDPYSTQGDVARLKQYSGEAVRFLRSLFPHHEITNDCDQMFAPIYDRSAWGNREK